MSTRTRFEKEAKGNSEMAYLFDIFTNVSPQLVQESTKFILILGFKGLNEIWQL